MDIRPLDGFGDSEWASPSYSSPVKTDPGIPYCAGYDEQSGEYVMAWQWPLSRRAQRRAKHSADPS